MSISSKAKTQEE